MFYFKQIFQEKPWVKGQSNGPTRTEIFYILINQEDTVEEIPILNKFNNTVFTN